MGLYLFRKLHLIWVGRLRYSRPPVRYKPPGKIVRRRKPGAYLPSWEKHKRRIERWLRDQKRADRKDSAQRVQATQQEQRSLSGLEGGNSSRCRRGMDVECSLGRYFSDHLNASRRIPPP